MPEVHAEPAIMTAPPDTVRGPSSNVLRNPRGITTAAMGRAFLTLGIIPEFDDWFAVSPEGVLESATPVVAQALCLPHGDLGDLIAAGDRIEYLARVCGLTPAYVVGFHGGWFGKSPRGVTHEARAGWCDGAKCYAHAAHEFFEGTWGVTFHVA